MLIQSVTNLVTEAKLHIANLSPEQVKEELTTKQATLIDLRESEELALNGTIAGSVHVPRGILEFSADPSHPSYKPEFKKGKRIILHCAAGNRSALATYTLQKMGYNNVAHLEGGLKAWREAGLPIIGK